MKVLPLSKILSISILLNLMISDLKSVSSLRILGIAPVRIHSHFVMSGTLFKGLAERGHQIDVYSYYPQEKSIPNYRDFTLNGSQSEQVNNVRYDELLPFSMSTIKILMEMWGNLACEELYSPIFQNLIKDPPSNPPYDVVLIEVSCLNFEWFLLFFIILVFRWTCLIAFWRLVEHSKFQWLA